MINFDAEILDQVHGVNEGISIDDYVLNIQFMYELFRKYIF